MSALQQNALILTAGGGNDRSALAAVRALASAGCRPVVAHWGDHSLAAVSRYTAATSRIPEPGSASFVAAVAKRARELSAVVFPSTDEALLALNPDLSRLLDKALLAQQAAAAGLSVPPTETYSDAKELMAAGSTVAYPVVVKPARKQPGWPAYVAHDRDEVRVGRVDEPIITQPLLTGATDAICGVVWKGEIVASLRQQYHRTWPSDCGTAAYARVVAPDPERLAGLERLLNGYDGMFQAQFVDGNLIDLNPRVYGSLPLAVSAGVNLPELVCRLSADRQVPADLTPVTAGYRWLEGDIRNRWQAIRTHGESWKRALGDLAPRRSTVHSVVAVRDLKPALARLRFAASTRTPDRS